MESWWSEVENDLLQCLRDGRPKAPDEIGRHVGLSEAATSSLLAMLVRDGKVRICLVERTDVARHDDAASHRDDARPPRAAGRRGRPERPAMARRAT
jgi:hypothetical protein